MDLFYALLLSGLEMTFIFVAIGLLHSQRKTIGSASFYLVLGVLFLFAQLVCAADLRIGIAGTLDFQLGSTVIFLPYLAALLLIYITEGTLAAQRLIIGSLAMFGMFLYLGEITRLQCEWIGFSIISGLPSDAFDLLLVESRNSMIGLVVAHLLDLFMLPVIFTRLKNAGCRMFVCVLGALSFTLIADSVLYALVLHWSDPRQLLLLSGSLLARAVAMVWLSFLLTVYLNRVEQEAEPAGRTPLDIFFAFLGGYGRSKILEESLREWEGRYQQVLSNASEMIVLLTPSGRVVDANLAAAKLLSLSSTDEMSGMRLFQWLRNPDGTALKLDLPKGFPVGAAEKTEPFIRHFQAIFGADPEHATYLSCSLTLQFLKGRPVLVLIGRDVTGEVKLAREKERLSEQLAHAQRIESLGQLAGGIAHDFNNHIHAILGHVDVINYMHAPDDPEVERHLSKIAEIAEQAGKLTSQLLGFARKGNYQIVDVDLQNLVERSMNLLIPKSRKNLRIEFVPPANPIVVSGDFVQLQQVLLNLMLNAIDAMTQMDRDHELRLAVLEGDAVEPFEPPPEIGAVNGADYGCIRVADNGEGMDEETRKKIFEPFFTTKPVGQGTGMGLAMVYGTVTSHHGWVQLASEKGVGTAFYVFLPKKKTA